MYSCVGEEGSLLTDFLWEDVIVILRSILGISELSKILNLLMAVNKSRDQTCGIQFNFVLENWQKINTEPVCFGARNNKPGVFNITKGGLVKTMKFIHISGSIRCNPIHNASYWGCTNQIYGNALLKIITNANKESVLSSDLEAFKPRKHTCGTKKHFYSRDGTNPTPQELVFYDLPNQLSVSCNQELQIWYGHDWMDCAEVDNAGVTCVDVYALYS